MRYFEITLKILFLALSGFLITNGDPHSSVFIFVLLLLAFVKLMLGFVLIFNKKPSYNYPHKKRDFLIRRIEGAALILFSAYVLWGFLPVIMIGLRLN